MQYKKEYLKNNTIVLVNDTHRFGTDAFLLSHFCQLKYGQVALDVGSGCGIIPLRWKDLGHKALAIGLEISKEGSELLDEAIKLNNFDNLLSHNGDIKDYKSDILFDLISCNPPYFTSGKHSDNKQKATFRHQITLNEEILAKQAFRLLKDGGKLCICQRPENLAKVIFEFKKQRLEPKRIQFVRHKKNSPLPWLVLVEAMKNAGEGVKILPDLIMENDDGSFTQEVLEIYKKV